jgi:hypothetical protein
MQPTHSKVAILYTMDSINWREHIGLIFGGLYILILTLKILIVSSFDPKTASAILAAVGAGDLFVATLLPTLKYVVNLTLVIFVISIQLARYHKGSAVSTFSKYLVLSNVAIVILIAPALLAIQGTLVASYIIEPMRDQPSRDSKKYLSRGRILSALIKIRAKLSNKTHIWRQMYIVIVIGLIFGAMIFDRSPWRPEEKVTFTNRTVRVGYVLQHTADSFVFLDAKKRTLEYLSPRAVSTRHICSPKDQDNDWSDRSLVSILFFQIPRYPMCP